jgi:hypothetical protein
VQYLEKHLDPIKPFACGGKALLRQPVGGSDLRARGRPWPRGPRAFSSEVDTGSREENASNKTRASVLINQNRALDVSDGLEPRPWMDFRLRQNGRSRPETFHQRTHERPDRRRGDQHRRLALARGLLEPAITVTALAP